VDQPISLAVAARSTLFFRLSGVLRLVSSLVVELLRAYGQKVSPFVVCSDKRAVTTPPVFPVWYVADRLPFRTFKREKRFQ
jgi:hypothetical protein